MKRISSYYFYFRLEFGIYVQGRMVDEIRGYRQADFLIVNDYS